MTTETPQTENSQPTEAPQAVAPPAPPPAAEGELASDSKLYAVLCYIISIIGVIIVLASKKEDKFAVFHAKQGLVLFIAGVIISVVAGLPIIGWFLVAPLGSIFLLILAILGIVNALNGQEKELPVIGKFGEKFNF